MTGKEPELDAAFIEKQRQSLTRLRATLLSGVRAAETEESTVNTESAGGAREYEDDAQKLTTLELDGERVARNVARVELVDRALKKIEEGTYGVSDLGGGRIPKERLVAIPESIYTAAEQQARERGG